MIIRLSLFILGCISGCKSCNNLIINLICGAEGSRAAYRALKAIGADVEYIEFPGCNHGSWNPAFNYPDFMEWLFNQKKK